MASWFSNRLFLMMFTPPLAIYSIVVSCQRHRKDPLAYMRDVLTRLPRMTNQDDLDALTPSNWTPA